MFEKGHRKYGGRKKGTPRTVSDASKIALHNFIESEITRLPETIQELSAKERIDALKALLPYVMPKKAEITAENEIKALLANLDNLTDLQLMKLESIVISASHNNSEN